MEFERKKILQGLPPSVDFFNGSPDTPAYNITHFEKIGAILPYEKAGTNTGVGNIKVKACDDAAKNNPVNVPFHYKRVAGETEGAIAEAVAANGVSTIANTNEVLIIEVRQKAVPEDKPFIYFDTTESVDDPVKGALVVIGYKPNYCGGAGFPTILS